MNSEKIKQILPKVALILGIISIIMIFFAAVKVSMMGMSDTCNGLNAIFGYKDVDSYGNKIQIFGFSFWALLPYVFGLGAGILAFIGYKKDNKLYKLASAVLFLVATILFFCMVDLIVIDPEAFQTQLTEEELERAINLFKSFMSTAFGTVFGGICCIFGMIIVLLDVFFDKIVTFFKKA